MTRKSFLLPAVLSIACLFSGMMSKAADSDTDRVGAEDYLLAQAEIADAEGADAGKHHKHMHFTDDQLEKLAALKDSYRNATASKKAQLHSLHMQMGQAMTANSIDRSRIGSLNDKINSLNTDLSKAHVSYMADRADVFTPEQRGEMHHMMLVHEAMGGGHHGWHHGGGCGGHHGGGEMHHHEGGPGGHGWKGEQGGTTQDRVSDEAIDGQPEG